MHGIFNCQPSEADMHTHSHCQDKGANAPPEGRRVWLQQSLLQSSLHDVFEVSTLRNPSKLLCSFCSRVYILLYCLWWWWWQWWSAAAVACCSCYRRLAASLITPSSPLVSALGYLNVSSACSSTRQRTQNSGTARSAPDPNKRAGLQPPAAAALRLSV